MDNFETMGDYLSKYNPFGIKDEKNNVLHFKDYGEIYLHTLKETQKYCQRGYLELPLLIKHLTGFDFDTATDIAELVKKNDKTIPEGPLFVDWTDVGYSKERFVSLMKGLHELTETTFDWVMFEYAWLRFKSWNDNYNKETLEK